MQSKYIVAGWVAAAAIAIAASISAVGIAQGGLLSTPSQPLSDEEVQEELAQAPAGASEGSPEPTAGTPAPEGSPVPEEQPTGQLGSVPDGTAPGGENEAVFPSDGGAVLARCSEGMAELVWWVPEQGYRIEEVVQGPAPYVEVEFEGGELEVEYSVTCVDGKPQASIEVDD
ncbi:hypothetical protein [Allosalinactinospora lopnorensis]|uniref:hypothetical protein n=1 Tax=Allosalinactinospora lopnorensis TaxID=1352348 RepID=UPI0006971984|nr:hypothetical protein [Allosalinactinospora lopnorensis]